MDRRAAIAGLAGLMGCAAAGAQPSRKVLRLGWLATGSTTPALADAFRQGLLELGYREGRNLTIDYRRSERSGDELDMLAGALVRLAPDAIFASGGSLSVLAARKASVSIPIVMSNVDYPVEIGLAATLARPGGNVTGLSTTAEFSYGKRLELVKNIRPQATRVAALWQRGNPTNEISILRLEQAARALGFQVVSLGIRAAAELAQAFAVLRNEPADALLPVNSPAVSGQMDRIVESAMQARMMIVGADERWADAGALVSYGPNFADLYRRAATYVDKILKGANAGHLPIEQPTTFQLVFNAGSAKRLDIPIPGELLLRADRLIE